MPAASFVDAWDRAVRKFGDKPCFLYVEDEHASRGTGPRRRKKDVPLDKRRGWDKATRGGIGGESFFSEQHAPTKAPQPLPAAKKKLSFRQIDERANKYAQWGLEQRIKPGMSVGMVVGNRTEFFDAWLGFCKIGVRLDVYRSGMEPRVILHCIQTSKPWLIIFEYTPEIEQCASELRRLDDEALATGSRTSGDGLNGMGWWTWGSQSLDWAFSLDSAEGPYQCKGRGAPSRDARAHVRSTDSCSTSYGGQYIMGSEPPMKAEATTHEQMVDFGQTLVTDTGISRRDVIHGGGLPLYHMLAGLGMLSVCVASGCTYLIKRKFATYSYLPECRRHACTIMHYSTELLDRLMAMPRDDVFFSGAPAEDRMHKLRLAIGRGIDRDEWQTIQQRFDLTEVADLTIGTVDGDNAMTYYEPRSIGMKRVTLERDGQQGRQVEWAPPGVGGGW